MKQTIVGLALAIIFVSCKKEPKCEMCTIQTSGERHEIQVCNEKDKQTLLSRYYTICR